jgi:flagellar hook-associated protein 3 FlgL
MRVTTTGFTETFKRQTNDSLYRQYQLQDKIASGLAFTKASDNPTSFALLKFQQTQQAETIGFEGATTEAKLQATRNYEAMADLQRTMSRANELVQRANGVTGSEGTRALGQEMQTLITQIQAIANRSYDGYFAFGGTQNLAPITDPGTGPLGYTYNPAVTTNNLKTIQIAANSTAVDVQIFAGIAVGANANLANSIAANPATGYNITSDFVGFLVKAGAAGQAAGTDTSGGVDIIAFLQNASTSLLAGTAINENQRNDLLRAGNYVAEYVGKTSATLAQFDLNKQSLNSVKQTGLERIANLSEADLPGLSTDLARTQQAYQGALASGSKLLQISLLDFLR